MIPASPLGVPGALALGTGVIVTGPIVVSPGGISPGESFGTPKVNAALKAAGIPSAAAFGTPTIAQRSILKPAGIRSAIAFGIPKLVADLRASAIPSAEAFGNPTIRIVIELLVGGIGSGESFGHLRVALVKTITVGAGIPSAAAFGTPQFSAGSVSITCRGIPSAAAFGRLQLTGGIRTPQIWIGGINRRAYFRVQTLDIQSQTSGRWQAHFDLIDKKGGLYGPGLGETVVITEYGRRLFAGCLRNVVVERFLSLNTTVFHCTALDKSSICDNRVVNAEYKAGADIKAVILDIAANSLDGEGITTNNVPATLGTLSRDLNYRMLPKVTRTFDDLAEEAGAIWWLDTLGDLHFSQLSGLDPCPFQITETSKNWRHLTVEGTLTDYRNIQYVVSNLATEPDPTAGQVIETYTLWQPAAEARGYYHGCLVLNFPASRIISLKVNGVAYPVESGYDFLNYRHSWWWFHDTPYINAPNPDNTQAPPPPFGSGPPYPTTLAPDPHVGDVVEIIYLSPNVSAAMATPRAVLDPLNPSGISPGGGRTCGSGKYEEVEQVQNISKASDLQAIAVAKLNRSNGIPTTLQVEVDEPGAAVGQVIHVDLPLNYLPSTDLTITSLSGRSQGVDLGHGSSMRWQITANVGVDRGNWIKWFERLVARTENPLPVVQFDEVAFVLAPGSSLASGVVNSNPGIASTAGKLIEIVAEAGRPPTDSYLLLDLLKNGVSVLKNRLMIPAGFGGLVITTDFFSTPTYVLKNDVFTMASSYVVTGPVPTRAGSVTVKARWALGI